MWVERLDFSTVALYQRLGWRDPLVFVNLSVVDGDRAFRRGRDEEPRGESLGRLRRGSPVRQGNERIKIDQETRLFLGLAHRGSPSRVEVVRGVRVVSGIDAAAGKDPHATKREL